ncbi:MAG TPA: hypothetical protein VK698_39615 [Kofleriaceae bacterium]|nr:hypothetical protein [Kofleriaceae bacterium]
MTATFRLRVGTDIRIEHDDYTNAAPALTFLNPGHQIAVTLLAAFDDEDAVAGADRLVAAVSEWRDGVRAAVAKQAAAVKAAA